MASLAAIPTIAQLQQQQGGGKRPHAAIVDGAASASKLRSQTISGGGKAKGRGALKQR